MALINRSAARRPGAALVEFAIVISLLLLMVFGVIELGRGYFVVHELNDAARQGCRAGVIEGRSTAL